MNEVDEAIARDVAAVNRISVVPAMLRVICKHTGLGFAAIARVTDDSWTACAVQDNISFGIRPGGKLDISTTLCLESRAARRPVVIDHATNDPIYRDHPTPRIYHIESYISVPIILPSGEYFGNLCAVDPRPAVVSDARTVGMFTLFAELIALQLDNEAREPVRDTRSTTRCPTSETRELYLALLGQDLRAEVESVEAATQGLGAVPSRSDLESAGEQIRAHTRRVKQRIDDIVDFTCARLGSGIHVHKAPVDNLATALESVIADHRTQHPAHVVNSSIVIGERVVCDGQRVRQLLSNLLDNALSRHRADARVAVEARIERGMVVICVGDCGAPIPQSELSRLFEPRPQIASASGHGGSTLGLFLCAQIVNAHAGSLQVSSSEHDGTHFVVMLPIGK